MYTVRKPFNLKHWIGERPSGSMVFLLFAPVLLLPLCVSCAGPSSNSSTSTGNGGDTAPRSDVKRERLEKLLDKSQRKRLKPSENSPGPVMVTLFTRRKAFSKFEGGLNRGSGTQSGSRQPSQAGQGKEEGAEGYRYLILLSKEWAYENRPVQEPFLEFARPGIKIMKDWQMNRFLKFLKQNSFMQFPDTGQVASSEIRNLSGSEKFITLWTGDRFRRVFFSEELSKKMNRMAQGNGSSSRIQKNSLRLLLGFIRAYNAAGLNRMQVEVGPNRRKDRIEKLADQASPETSQKLKEKLFQARTLHRNGENRKAKNILTNLIDDARGTTYYVDVRNLLYSVNQALNEGE